MSDERNDEFRKDQMQKPQQGQQQQKNPQQGQQQRQPGQPTPDTAREKQQSR